MVKSMYFTTFSFILQEETPENFEILRGIDFLWEDML